MLDHTGIAVADLNRSKAFYTRAQTRKREKQISVPRISALAASY
jgi:catechol 2,3-dioxygenase-like lactoylglutathione lyase family enzyme